MPWKGMYILTRWFFASFILSSIYLSVSSIVLQLIYLAHPSYSRSNPRYVYDWTLVQNFTSSSTFALIMSASSNSTSWSRPYPPPKSDGIVDEHDKPFFYYGHIGIIHINAIIMIESYLLFAFVVTRSIIRCRKYRTYA